MIIFVHDGFVVTSDASEFRVGVHGAEEDEEEHREQGEHRFDLDFHLFSPFPSR